MNPPLQVSGKGGTLEQIYYRNVPFFSCLRPNCWGTLTEFLREMCRLLTWCIQKIIWCRSLKPGVCCEVQSHSKTQSMCLFLHLRVEAIASWKVDVFTSRVNAESGPHNSWHHEKPLQQQIDICVRWYFCWSVWRSSRAFLTPAYEENRFKVAGYVPTSHCQEQQGPFRQWPLFYLIRSLRLRIYLGW